MNTQYSSDNPENQVRQYNMIEGGNYNVMSTKGKQSMVGNLVEFQDGKIYEITKTGSLKRMPKNFSIGNQEELSARYIRQQEMLKEQQKIEAQNQKKSKPIINLDTGKELSNEVFEMP
ncbi:hypothetical protein HN385_07370 [archaeon]|jgi:hypothetical protein|nr:hypothetical protein [archaeon]